MIHQTAIVDKSAIIGQNVEIGPYVIIGEGVSIGDGTIIGPHAIVEYSDIGKNCKLFGHAIIGTEPQHLKYAGEKTKTIIGDGSVMREYVTVNRATSDTGKTIVGENCLLMAYVHIGHDSVLGNNVIIANACSIAGHVEIADNVVFGGMAAVHQFTKVGRNAIIGGGSKVNMDIIPFVETHGDRAKLVGLNLIGLKRHKMSSETIDAIKQAYRTLFMSKLTLEEALSRLIEVKVAEVQEIVTFIRRSQRGIARNR
ncbi:MAG: acyl-ACP--UDP-N-acetylglucosamine O-acyltransferase [Endomicrobiaceae bacterium]|nr:acyl-ACP--UDP-N-acetylglucosamine O-acyltransferase [Endomicrobiaceae bacterium]